MEVILNAGLGIGAVMFFLLLFKKEKKQGDYFFLVWIITTFFQIAFYEITIYRFEIQGFWAILGFALPLLGAPFLFLYIAALSGRHVSWKTILIHSSIYVIYVVLFFILQKRNAITLTIVNGYFPLPDNPNFWMQYYAVPLAMSGLVYCVWDLWLLKKHRKTIVELFSYNEKINLKWVSYIVYSYFTLFILASFLIFGATQFQLFPIKDAFALVGISLSVMLIAFGFYGFQQTAIFSNVNHQNNNSTKGQIPSVEKSSYSKSGLTPEKIESLANQLSMYMEVEKPFLNEDLNLSLLSEQIYISQPYLSQVINQYFNLNFYDYINQYRIEEAKQKLTATKFDHLSILGIAFESGFKSKSSFNRYFKKYTGYSPSEFKKKKTL